MALAPARSNSFESIPLESGPGTSGQSRLRVLPTRRITESGSEYALDQMVPRLLVSYRAPSEEEKMKDEHHNHRKRMLSFLFTFSSLVLLLSGITAQAQTQQIIDPVIDPLPVVLPAPSPIPACARTIKADVVAFDQVIMYNRLGTVNPGGMIYALKKDVVPIDPLKGIVAGNVRLRSDKRPRPIVLRMNS